MRSARAVAALLALSVLAAACGSTVRDVTGTAGVDAAAASIGGGSLDGFAVPTDPAQSPAPGLGGTAATTASGSGLGGGSTAVTTGGGTAPGSATTPATSPAATSPDGTVPSGPSPASTPHGATSAGGLRPVSPGTPGVTDDAIRVGLSYAVNSGAANEAIGAAGITQGDGRRNYEVLAEHFNAVGGAAGRRIEPVYFEVDSTSAQSSDQVAQQECAHFTQDNDVYAVLLNSRTDTSMACFDQAGVAFLEASSLSFAADSTYRSFPRFITADAPSLSTIGRFYAPGLDRIGFFDPESPLGETKVGLVTFDQPRFTEAAEQAVIPAMRASGRDFEDVVYLAFPASSADLGALQAGIANTVLRFRSAGIDHVMFLEVSALITFLFMQNAESQGYRPQYGMNTNSGGQALVGLVPAAQLGGALTVGNFDMFDVVAEDHTPTPARAQCDQIYAEGDVTFADLNARAVGYIHCGSFMALVTALDSESGPIDGDSITNGLIAAGGYDSPVIGPTTFRPDKRDGASRYRGIGYDTGCGCFRAITDYFPIQ